ncbi:MAG: Site-specific recombinase, invertase Pin s [Anaerocolumna sp.]|jgi:DNA invertase Pin-like site-specific DNA recombinase|nr:Site-specific recombinase, invertase Pin s [Anaerocolumna sp.]
MMNAVAYCRVSTNKEEQLDSLETQQKFFYEYARRNSYNLVQIYADEGKSGTKIKNRTQLLKLLSDAESQTFQVVLIKDVSRLARNTVDFLTSIRKLKTLGVKVVFVNYDQTSSDSSEFMLTLLSAIAQEESANTSKRVKFGKRMNAEKGKVPNLIYGYDKIIGENFNLHINKNEAEVIRQIFRMYTEEKMGTSRIAKELNKEGCKTKRGCNWSQCAVVRLLSNEIYIGKVINAKEEVIDYLTGARKRVQEDKRLITFRPNLQIIEEETFMKAKKLLEDRKASFAHRGNRESDTQVFSRLIYCKCCGRTFRRIVRTYKNTYAKWVCTGRNSYGVDACQNRNTMEEKKLLGEIVKYFRSILLGSPKAPQVILTEYNRRLIQLNGKEPNMEEFQIGIIKLKKEKQKYMEMFQNDIIEIKELKETVNRIHKERLLLENEIELLKYKNYGINTSVTVLNPISLEEILVPERITNQMLRKVIAKITIDENFKIDVYLNKI